MNANSKEERPRTRRVSFLTFLSSALLLGSTACADVETSEPGTLDSDDPVEFSQRRARLQITVAQHREIVLPEAPAATPDENDPLDPALELKAMFQAAELAAQAEREALETPSYDPVSETLRFRGDFAEYRGVEEKLVWAYAGVEPTPWEVLDVGDCALVSHVPTRLEGREAPFDGRTREIALLDMGGVQVQVGNERYEVPMHLAPGVLPYASGVQYRGTRELQPSPSDPSRGQNPLSLHWDGLDEFDLPAASFKAELPPALDLDILRPEFRSEHERAWIDLVWSPSPESQTKGSELGRPEVALYLRAYLTPSAETKYSDDVVICRMEDSGQWQLDLDRLADLGLRLGHTQDDSNPAELSVELRRVHRYATQHAGFDQLSLEVERSESASFRIPSLAESGI